MMGFLRKMKRKKSWSGTEKVYEIETPNGIILTNINPNGKKESCNEFKEHIRQEQH